MPYINAPGGGSGAISGVTITGTGAAGDVPVATSSSAGSWVFPPGHEFGYTQITAPVNVTDTAEATATALISPGAITFDGGAVMCEFFSPGIFTPTTASVTDFVAVSLFEGATQISELAVVAFGNGTTPQQYELAVYGSLRFTPTAAAHTYKITAFCNAVAGTPRIGAGAGGTAALPPAYVRFTKV